MIKPRTDKQRHWAKILEEAESSEMSLADYARANNLGVQTLYQWRSTLKVQHKSTQESSMHFSQVVATSSVCTLSVELNSAQLRFDRFPDVQWLSAFDPLTEPCLMMRPGVDGPPVFQYLSWMLNPEPAAVYIDRMH